jgi:hypothetical protein
MVEDDAALALLLGGPKTGLAHPEGVTRQEQAGYAQNFVELHECPLCDLGSRKQFFEPYLKALTLRRGPHYDISYQQSSLEQGKARWPEVTAQTRTNMGYPHSVRDC